MNELRPSRLHLKKESHLEVLWPDGLAARLPIRLLRARCPCAGCRELRTQLSRNRLTVLPPGSDMPTLATGAEMVGNYAIRIRWSDGHEAGLYSWDLLRELSEAQQQP